MKRHTAQQRGIMVWGASTYDSKSPLVWSFGNMTARRYVDGVLHPVTLPFLQGVPNAIYQQYNAILHGTHPWPSAFPDLSPIEHV